MSGIRRFRYSRSRVSHSRPRVARSQHETKLDETKLSFKTTEFYAMAGVIVAILAASAYSDSLGDVRAWTLVAGIAAAYIISRGEVAKLLTENLEDEKAALRKIQNIGKRLAEDGAKAAA